MALFLVSFGAVTLLGFFGALFFNASRVPARKPDPEKPKSQDKEPEYKPRELIEPPSHCFFCGCEGSMDIMEWHPLGLDYLGLCGTKTRLVCNICSGFAEAFKDTHHMNEDISPVDYILVKVGCGGVTDLSKLKKAGWRPFGSPIKSKSSFSQQAEQAFIRDID